MSTAFWEKFISGRTYSVFLSISMEYSRILVFYFYPKRECDKGATPKSAGKSDSLSPCLILWPHTKRPAPRQAFIVNDISGENNRFAGKFCFIGWWGGKGWGVGRWTQNAPASSAFGARRAVLGRKRLLLTPAAVCASPPGGYRTAIAPIPTQTPLFKTAA